MSPQKKAILVGLILGVGILLALPFRHSHPPVSEEVPNRVARDIWLQKPGWNADEEEVQALGDATANQKHIDPVSPPGNSLLQKMEDDLEPILKRPVGDAASAPQPVLERTVPPRPAQERPAPASSRTPPRSYSTGNATLGSELVDLPPDVVVVERPADQFAANNDDIQGATNEDSSRVEQRKPVQQTEPRAPRTVRHIVRDGDTLQSLAARYLGDARRGLEIFNANRAKLQNPKALPIDDELIIILK